MDTAAALGISAWDAAGGSIMDDFDGDGLLDVVSTSWGATANMHFFRNNGDGTFSDRTKEAGLIGQRGGFNAVQGDYDNDGDQDIYAQLGGAVPGDAFGNALFQNPGHGNNWITIRLRGTKSNHFGVGVRIKMTVVDDKGGRSLRCRQVNWGGSFGSSSLQQEIGLGPGGRIESLEIRWPASGTTQTFKNVKANRIIEITEGAGGIKEINLPRIKLPDGKHEHRHMG